MLAALPVSSVGKTMHRSRWGSHGGGHLQLEAANETCVVAVVFQQLSTYIAVSRHVSLLIWENYIYIYVYVYSLFIGEKIRMCCICNSKLLVFYLESPASGFSWPF